MTFDFIPLLERLADHSLKAFAPALPDPKLARSAGILALVLKSAAKDIDAAPGRFRRQRADMERLISAYAEHAGDARFAKLLAAPTEMDRLSDYYAHDNALKEALIAVADTIEGLETAWAADLQQDMRAAYLRWTE